jgi:hypothetical protein
MSRERNSRPAIIRVSAMPSIVTKASNEDRLHDSPTIEFLTHAYEA